ncbi:MAG: hypothetical protein R2712_16210 [Vicinamibacterales bacterium]
MTAPRLRPLLPAAAVMVLGLGAGARLLGQSPIPFPGTLDEHPAIGYASRPTSDAVARLNAAMNRGEVSLDADSRTGLLRSVLDALDVAVESQVLVFSRTALQRDYTGPRNPRALYFNESVAVGYIPGAPVLELAAHDPAQGVVFYTLDATGGPAARFTRRTTCLDCHLATSTLEVPGMIARSHAVAADGTPLLRLGTHAVDHRTPLSRRWGGWFVTGPAANPPGAPLGSMGNQTVSSHAGADAASVSNRVLANWLDRPREGDRYPSSDSDLAALLTFDHQMHAINLLTRVNWDARMAAGGGADMPPTAADQARVRELADYLVYADEAPLPVPVVPRPGFAEHLASRVPADGQGRSCAQLDLASRLARYPCSFMIYSPAFAALPDHVRDAVYERIFAVLDGQVDEPAFARLTPEGRRAAAEILRATRDDLPAALRASTRAGGRP